MGYLIVVGILYLLRHGVALGIVEDHNVAALDLTDAGEAMVVELGIVEIAFRVDDGESVLGKRKVEGSLRHS